MSRLPIEPFHGWITVYVEHATARGETLRTIAAEIGVDEARVRKWLRGGEVINDAMVDRVGVALGEIRLLEDLYPLDEVAA